jgi:anti-sigma B factor antagonist
MKKTGDYLQVRQVPNGETDILYVDGELDVGSGPTLEDAVTEAARLARNGEIWLDLGGLTFVDASGANTLLALSKTLESCGQRVICAGPTPQVHSVLKILGLDEVLNITR